MPAKRRAKPKPKEEFYVLDTANETVLCVATTEARAIKEANFMADADEWDGNAQNLVLCKKVAQLYIEITPKVVKAS